MPGIQGGIRGIRAVLQFPIHRMTSGKASGYPGLTFPPHRLVLDKAGRMTTFILSILQRTIALKKPLTATLIGRSGIAAVQVQLAADGLIVILPRLSLPSLLHLQSLPPLSTPPIEAVPQVPRHSLRRHLPWRRRFQLRRPPPPPVAMLLQLRQVRIPPPPRTMEGAPQAAIVDKHRLFRGLRKVFMAIKPRKWRCRHSRLLRVSPD